MSANAKIHNMISGTQISRMKNTSQNVVRASTHCLLRRSTSNLGSEASDPWSPRRGEQRSSLALRVGSRGSPRRRELEKQRISFQKVRERSVHSARRLAALPRARAPDLGSARECHGAPP